MDGKTKAFLVSRILQSSGLKVCRNFNGVRSYIGMVADLAYCPLKTFSSVSRRSSLSPPWRSIGSGSAAERCCTTNDCSSAVATFSPCKSSSSPSRCSDLNSPWRRNAIKYPYEVRKYSTHAAAFYPSESFSSFSRCSGRSPQWKSISPKYPDGPRRCSTHATAAATSCPPEDSPRLPHTPVMPVEVVEYMNPRPGDTIVDMTFGSGGHSRRLLQSFKDLKVVAVDRDPVASEFSKELAKEFPSRVVPILARFSELSEMLEEKGIVPGSVAGFLLDLGCSSMQMDDGSRGFSLSKEGPLDMRMDGGRFPDQPTAADVIEHAKEEHLQRILKVYGEEKQSKKIARAVVESRYLFKRLHSTSELADLVNSTIGHEPRFDKLGRPAHCATKTFQALRIFVNNEVNELCFGIDVAHKFLRVGGRLVALSFHSLEDRIVKRQLVGIDLDEGNSRTLSQKYRNAASWHSKDEVVTLLEKKWFPVNKHVMTPSTEEVLFNPRARSAKMRVAIKIH